MAIKREKTLTETINRLTSRRRDDAVRIEVPAVDPADDCVRNARRNLTDVENLKEERDRFKEENDDLRGKVEFLMKANKHIAEEREECRRQSNAAFTKVGRLSATLDGMKAFIERMSGDIRDGGRVAEEHRQQSEPPRPEAIYDTDGLPLDTPPPAPTLEECESLSTVLARVD